MLQLFAAGMLLLMLNAPAKALGAPTDPPPAAPSAATGDDEGEAKGETGSADDAKQEPTTDDDAESDAGESTGNADGDAKADEADSTEADDEPAEKVEERKAKPPEKKKLDLHKVATKDLEIKVELDGAFIAEETEEVALRPEVWSSFKVVKAVKHGQRVRKGDVLVEFDDKDIEEAIAERGLAQQLGEVALMQAEDEFPRLEKSIELNYELAKRNHEQNVQEYERFQKTMRELSEKLAKYYLKSAEQELDNAREELEQLRKMYEADELTEETEEIVLRRQEFQVEVAEFSLEYEKINHDYTMNVSIPRRNELLTTAVEQSRLAFDQAKMAKSLGLSKERYELQAQREARARSIETHANLVADRALMKLRAPRDGLAYYGRCVNGRWIEVGSMESKLAPFGSVSPNSVVMTIVSRLPMYVETGVGEKEFPAMKTGLSATITPLADADLKLDSRVERVANVPGSGNKFTLRLELKSEDDVPEWLMPGMTCKASITTYEVEDAVVIPVELIQTDEGDDEAKYVMVLEGDDEKPVRRELKLGKTKGKEVEILGGLKEGDQIVKGAKDESKSDA
jgi:multidrug efflux pump subunit AcrA (membrane-fusion protein)